MGRCCALCDKSLDPETAEEYYCSGCESYICEDCDTNPDSPFGSHEPHDHKDPEVDDDE
jgi:hypothetical protein